jgi:hypothetical protein
MLREGRQERRDDLEIEVVVVVVVTVGAALQDADLVVQAFDDTRLTLLPGSQYEAMPSQ